MTESQNKSGYPMIVLDTTLAELLSEDGRSKESLCNIKPCADRRHKTVPINLKYLITSTQSKDGDDLAHLQLENVSYLLSFWAGNMEVILVACEGWSKDDTLTREVIQQNATRNFAILDKKQRPWATVYENRDHFTDQKRDNPIRWGFAVDFAEKVPYFIHPELHYRLNSKRWLGVCNLRSANDQLLDPDCACETHDNGSWYFESGCKTCEQEVEKELQRITDLLEKTNVPYVLKLNQALGSVGTFIVRNKDDKKKTIEQIQEIQRTALRSVTSENNHIHPVSLILSDLLPGGTIALNFFVRQDGSVKFLGACHQLSTRTQEGGRQHTALTWDQQDELENKYKATLADIGNVLHAEGYFGPCGADIMELDGQQYVIDLNVRTTTSTVLGLLKGHCIKRGFNVCAVYECLLLSISREDLEQKFHKELVEGRIILLGSTRLGKKDKWAYPVVIAGETNEAVTTLGKRILESEASLGDDSAEDAGGA